MAAEGDSTPGTVSCEWLRDALERKTPDLILLDVTWYSDKDARQLYNEYVEILHACFLAESKSKDFRARDWNLYRSCIPKFPSTFTPQPHTS